MVYGLGSTGGLRGCQHEYELCWLLPLYEVYVHVGKQEAKRMMDRRECLYESS
jgi:hypothetical protein